ncbi:MAG: glycosyltransferase family 2 protein [Burkholderiales bacterium]
MSDEPRVAVVVVSYETRETLLEGLAALASEPDASVVVVDNASSDGSAAAVRARFPSVRLIANPENVGFARACNQGARDSRAPFLLFLNPDATLAPGSLTTLAALLQARPRVGAVGPRTRSANGDIQVSTGPDLSLLSEIRQRRLVRGVALRDAAVLVEAEGLHAVEREADWVSGACLLIRREVFDAVSGFDERFFLYEEDADLCRRVREAGFNVLYSPAAEACHALGRSMARDPGRARLEYQRSHLLYYRKHCGLLQRVALRLWLVARAALALVHGALSLNAPRTREALALFRVAVAA